MRVTKFTPPYNKNGKTNFPLRNRPGVYIIKEDGVIVYVGSSKSNCYSTMYRHFEKWKDDKMLSYESRMEMFYYTVRVIYTTATQAPALEKMLIKRYQPRDNVNLYLDIDTNRYEIQTFETYKNTEVEAPF